MSQWSIKKRAGRRRQKCPEVATVIFSAVSRVTRLLANRDAQTNRRGLPFIDGVFVSLALIGCALAETTARLRQ